MRAFWGWIAGKKPKLLATLLAVTVSVLVYLGKLTPETALAIALAALGVIGVAFHNSVTAHQAKILAILADVAAAGAAARTHNRDAQIAAAVAVATDGAQLVAAIDALPPVSVQNEGAVS